MGRNVDKENLRHDVRVRYVISTVMTHLSTGRISVSAARNSSRNTAPTETKEAQIWLNTLGVNRIVKRKHPAKKKTGERAGLMTRTTFAPQSRGKRPPGVVYTRRRKRLCPWRAVVRTRELSERGSTYIRCASRPLVNLSAWRLPPAYRRLLRSQMRADVSGDYARQKHDRLPNG